MDVNRKVQEVVQILRRDSAEKADLADRLTHALDDLSRRATTQPKSRISPAGLRKIRAAAAGAWFNCPRGCAVKHRAGHPHMKKVASPSLVPKRAA